MVVGESDGIARDLVWVDRAVPQPHEDTGGLKPAEEVVLVNGRHSGRTYLAAELVPGYLRPALSVAFVLLRCGWPPVAGVVNRAYLVQAVALFEVSGGGLRLDAFVPGPDGLAVLPDERGHDVNVVVGVANGHPSHSVRVAMRGDADGGDDLGGDVRPLAVGEDAVGDVVADGGVPDELLWRVPAGPDGLFEQAGQGPDVVASGGVGWGFQRR